MRASAQRAGAATIAGVVALVAVLLAVALFVAADSGSARTARTEAPVAIAVRAQPIPAFDTRDLARRRFGLLEFRGGLVLTSHYREFGGISSLHVEADGAHFVATTDKGRWLAGRIVYDGARPVGIADAEMAPLLGPDGRSIRTRRWYDAEAIAADGGTLYVALERVHRILRYDYGRDGLYAHGRTIAAPAQMRRLVANKGIEGLIHVPRGQPLAGTLIAFSERGLDGNGNIRGFLIGGKSPGTFAVRRRDEFDISDAALLPSGDILVLERRFGWTTGVASRIRRMELAAFAPGAIVDGPVIFQADMGYQIDNMEGIGIHRTTGGETVLTLISDDNFSILQRTLLLQFTLAED